MGDGDADEVVVKSAVGAALVVVEAEALLELAVSAALTPPRRTSSLQPHKLLQTLTEVLLVVLR